MKSSWKTYLLYLSLIILGVSLLFILTETVRAKNTGFETKTLWDWMELLIIPFVLALGAFFLNRSERALERNIADDRAKLERDLATDRQQEAALQTYFDRMSELLLKEKLRTTKKAEVRDVARTRTLSIMRVLDTRRNNSVLQFLRETKLITDEKSIFNDAMMDEMTLQELNLNAVYLQRANLYRANLQGVFLGDANLQGANLRETNLRGAYLYSVNLQSAILYSANLQDAMMNDANFQLASLAEANLQGAILYEVNLQGAILENADLEGTNLKDAKNMTEEQLAQVKSLKGATMPDGTIHE